MNAPVTAILKTCYLCGFDAGAMLVGIAVGLALGIAAAVAFRRAGDQDDFPSDPYEREFVEWEGHRRG